VDPGMASSSFPSGPVIASSCSVFVVFLVILVAVYLIRRHRNRVTEGSPGDSHASSQIDFVEPTTVETCVATYHHSETYDQPSHVPLLGFSPGLVHPSEWAC
jgi:hypothetical protein